MKKLLLTFAPLLFGLAIATGASAAYPTATCLDNTACNAALANDLWKTGEGSTSVKTSKGTIPVYTYFRHEYINNTADYGAYYTYVNKVNGVINQWLECFTPGYRKAASQPLQSCRVSKLVRRAAWVKSTTFDNNEWMVAVLTRIVPQKMPGALIMDSLWPCSTLDCTRPATTAVATNPTTGTNRWTAQALWKKVSDVYNARNIAYPTNPKILQGPTLISWGWRIAKFADTGTWYTIAYGSATDTFLTANLHPWVSAGYGLAWGKATDFNY